MKKIILILFALTGFFISGCNIVYYQPSYYATVYNDEYDKYITAVYYRDWSYNGNRWSVNQIEYDIPPYESFDLYLTEGTYDFKVIMEDDYYSYTIYEEDVWLNQDIWLEFCVDCKKDKPGRKIEITPKNSLTKTTEDIIITNNK